MNVRLALHWAKTLAAAVALSGPASLPFSGQSAAYVVVLTSAGVGMTGLATAPTVNRKDGRP